MTNQNSITTLIDFLNVLASTSSNTSESANRGAMTQAQTLVRESGLASDVIGSVCAAIKSAANPSGWSYDTNGIKAGLEALDALQPKKDEEKVSLFTKAHALTKKIIKAGDSYSATFAACLKMAYRNINQGVEVLKSLPLNRANLKNLVSPGSIFNVKFIKRTTGELRSMTCRMGVQKHLKGGKKGFSDKQKHLLTVFDMQAKGYRSIPVDGIQHLSINGQSFSFAEAL